MQIIINTIHGTFVVPRDKESQLIAWLQHNAVRADTTTYVKEQNVNGQLHNQHPQYGGTQLLVD